MSTEAERELMQARSSHTSVAPDSPPVDRELPIGWSWLVTGPQSMEPLCPSCRELLPEVQRSAHFWRSDSWPNRSEGGQKTANRADKKTAIKKVFHANEWRKAVYLLSSTSKHRFHVFRLFWDGLKDGAKTRNWHFLKFVKTAIGSRTCLGSI